MICLRSIPYGEEWVLVLQSSQHPLENSRSSFEFPDFSSDYIRTHQTSAMSRFQPLNIFVKSSIVDVRQGSIYASELYNKVFE